jgi:hypothetical protein
MNLRHLHAECLTCNVAYGNMVPIEHVKKVRSEVANRDIWAQTHVDTTGHTRIRFTDTTETIRILSRSNQMTFAEDPDINLKGLMP